MSRLYDDNHRRLQAEFDSTGLADAVEAATLRSEIGDEDAAFIHARDMFFLSTVNAAGQPTVSYNHWDNSHNFHLLDRSCHHKNQSTLDLHILQQYSDHWCRSYHRHSQGP